MVNFYFLFLFRPLSNPHDILQLMGRGGRGPTVRESSIEIVWNNSDLSHNVPGLLQKIIVSKVSLIVTILQE